MVAEAKAVQGRLESAASEPMGMSQLVGDVEDLGGAAVVPFNAKPVLLSLAAFLSVQGLVAGFLARAT